MILNNLFKVTICLDFYLSITCFLLNNQNMDISQWPKYPRGAPCMFSCHTLYHMVLDSSSLCTINWGPKSILPFWNKPYAADKVNGCDLFQSPTCYKFIYTGYWPRVFYEPKYKSKNISSFIFNIKVQKELSGWLVPITYSDCTFITV